MQKFSKRSASTSTSLVLSFFSTFLLGVEGDWLLTHVIEIDKSGHLVKLRCEREASGFWVPISSARLAPFGSQIGSKPNQSWPENLPFPDDSQDPENVFAVWRGKEFGSLFYVENVNLFGKLGCFDALLRRLGKNNSNRLPPAFITNWLSTFSMVQSVLDFVLHSVMLTLLWLLL